MICTMLRCVRPIYLDVWHMLNDVFAGGLPGLVGLSVHPQRSRSLQLPPCIGLPLSCHWSVLFVSRIFSQVCSPSLLPFIFRNFASIFRETYALNWHKLLINAAINRSKWGLDHSHCNKIVQWFLTIRVY